MARVIAFYVPQSFRLPVKNALTGPGKIIAFPVGNEVRERLENEVNSASAERRRNPRGGFLTRIEDATYRVLRGTDREAPQPQRALTLGTGIACQPSGS